MPDSHILSSVLVAVSAKAKDCRDHSLANTVRKYVIDIRGMDFSDCPDSFRFAFARHATAWEDSIPFFERFPNLRGEMHELFETIRRIDRATTADLEKTEKPVWDTWSEVEKASGEKRT